MPAVRCARCGSGRIRRARPRTAWQRLVRAATPLERYACGDCGHRGFRRGALPAAPPRDHAALGLPARRRERRDVLLARRNLRRFVAGALLAAALGAGAAVVTLAASSSTCSGSRQ